MQWIQDPSQRNVNNMNKVRRDASIYFRKQKKAYLEAKIEELGINSKIKNIRDMYRGISDFKNGYQPRTAIVKDEKGNLFADCYSILAKWMKYFSQLLNVRGVKDVRQTEIHTAEPLVPEPSSSAFELAIESLNNHRSPGTDQIKAELIKAGVERLAVRVTNLLLLFGIRRNCLSVGRSPPFYVSIRRVIKQMAVIIGHSLFPTRYKILFNVLLSRLTAYALEIIGDHQGGFRRNRSTTDHTFCIRQILEKNVNTTKQRISSL